MVIVIFPFFIFYYEADDEGMGAEAASGGSRLAACCNFTNVKRSLASACAYTLIVMALCALTLWLMFTYLGTTYVPYTLTTVSVANVFQPGMEAAP
jgi:hypothetical protein